MKSLTDRRIKTEFRAFLTESMEPPPEIGRKLREEIFRALHPSRSLTLLKVFLFHAAGSLVTLVFCPQYGLSLLRPLGVVPDLLMRVHPAVCFFGCGVLWMIGGQALTYRLLTIDEQRVMGNLRWGMALTITVVTILLFACVGSLEWDLWLALWALGAGTVSLAFNWPVERRFRRWRKAAVAG